MYQNFAVLAALLAAISPMPVVSHGHRSNIATSQLHNLGQELFGAHFEWARGWLNADPEEVVDLGADLTPKVVPKVALAILPTLTIPCYKITIPVINKVVFDLIEPCGSVQIPAGGLTFKTPFGSKTLTANEVDQEAEAFDHECGKYTVYGVAAMVLVYVFMSLSTPVKRQAVILSFKQVASGHLESDQADPMMPQAEQDAAAKDKLDPASANFICPGNIYRLLVIMHPGVVGYAQWAKYCVKAGICAYMQLYLPFNIMNHCFKMWQFNGIKSPVYFVLNGYSFFLQFGALANVCTLFASKCCATIEGDAVACHHILSMTTPGEDASRKVLAGGAQGDAENKKASLAAPASGASKVTPLLSAAEEGKVPTAAEVQAKLQAELLAQIPMPPQWLLDWNEYFWCLLNLVVTIVGSLMLMIAMFMKVATFSGDIMNIALVTVSLYFIFELDNKVMESDPKLKGRYRREVLKQSEAADREPLWIKQASAYAIALINAMLPFGLLMIIVVSWRQVLDAAGLALRPGEKFTIVGADPFIHQ